MTMHPFRADAHGTSRENKNTRTLASVFATALLLALPCGVLAAENAAKASNADKAGDAGGLFHMSDMRPGAGTTVLPSFGGDPFAAQSPDAMAPDAMAPDAAAPDAGTQGTTDEGSGTADGTGTAEASDVPNFGALPDIARADKLREEQERDRERAEKNRSRNEQGQDKNGQDTTGQGAGQNRDARERELASSGSETKGANKTGADRAGARPGRGESLAIPEGAAQSGDTTFLAGCWRSESALRRTGTDIPLQIEYCFDENGNGLRIHTEDNNRCEGPVTAAFKQRTLVIEGGEIPCTDGTSYTPTTVECSQVDGRTICSGKESKPDGGHNLWDARFRKSS